MPYRRSQPGVHLAIKETSRQACVYYLDSLLKNYRSKKFYEDISVAPWSFADAFSDVDDKLYVLFFIQRYSNEHALIKTFKARGKPNPCVNDNNSWRQGIAGVKGQRKPMSLWRGLPTGTLGVKLNMKLDLLRKNL